MDVAARRIGQREIPPVALAVPDEEAVRMEGRLELVTDEPRDARSRFELPGVVDQLDQYPLPIVGLPEEPAIQPARQLRPVAQADDRGTNQIQVNRVGPEQPTEWLLTMHQHAIGQAGNRQRQQGAERIPREQILKAAADDERDVEDVVFDDRVAETDRDRHRREVHVAGSSD